MDGFHALMEQHREVSRGGGESSAQQTAAQLVGPGRQPSEFVGYAKTSVLTRGRRERARSTGRGSS